MICWKAATDWGSVSVCQIRTVLFSAAQDAPDKEEEKTKIKTAAHNQVFLCFIVPSSFLDGFVKSPSAALRFTFGKGVGGWA
jgi:hypothetical protein